MRLPRCRWEQILIVSNLTVVHKRSLVCYTTVLNHFSRLVQENADVAMDSIIHITQQMSQAKRAEVARILEAFDSTKPANGNGNGSDSLTE